MRIALIIGNFHKDSGFRTDPGVEQLGTRRTQHNLTDKRTREDRQNEKKKKLVNRRREETKRKRRNRLEHEQRDR
jgi:hypothetical protein